MKNQTPKNRPNNNLVFSTITYSLLLARGYSTDSPHSPVAWHYNRIEQGAATDGVYNYRSGTHLNSMVE